MKDKISKFISVTKRDGLLTSIKKAWKYILANYYNKINIGKRIYYRIHRKEILKQIDEALSKKYDRIIVWRSSFGWNVPLFQRSQQIAKCLSEDTSIVFYEVTRMTDKTKFIDKINDRLYLINYEIKSFRNDLFTKLLEINKPKYLQLYSTCWNVKKEDVDLYVENGFKMLYEYIDDLNPVLAGTDKLPKNVEDIHNYVINNIDNVMVVTSADNLYKDMVIKRKSEKNVILSSNGVDLKHFQNAGNEKITVMEDIKKKHKLIVGYYGALASWFDYKLVMNLAKNNSSIAFVLIGIKYDTTFDESGIENVDNIYYVGPVNYEKLPSYARYFDIAWIPFVINEITLATNPIKVFEYMALNKLIVTSPMPECKKYKSVFIADKEKDYEDIFKNYKKLKTKEYDKILSKEAIANSWENKEKDIINLLSKNE
jgi:hypothetical protein